MDSSQEEKKVIELKLDDIIPNRFQPREVFDEDALKELADSIKEHGVIQPVIVRKFGDKYELIAGERRCKASSLAGKTTIPAIIRESDDNESAKLSLLENLQRKNLSAIEEARTYKRILELEPSMTQEALARTLGRSQPMIANKLRLLSLPEEVQDSLIKNQISERHARSLLNLKSKEKQLAFLERVKKERLTVRELEGEIKKSLQEENKNEKNENKERLEDRDMNNENMNQMPNGNFNNNPYGNSGNYRSSFGNMGLNDYQSSIQSGMNGMFNNIPNYGNNGNQYVSPFANQEPFSSPTPQNDVDNQSFSHEDTNNYQDFKDSTSYAPSNDNNFMNSSFQDNSSTPEGNNSTSLGSMLDGNPMMMQNANTNNVETEQGNSSNRFISQIKEENSSKNTNQFLPNFDEADNFSNQNNFDSGMNNFQEPINPEFPSYDDNPQPQNNFMPSNVGPNNFSNNFDVNNNSNNNFANTNINNNMSNNAFEDNNAQTNFMSSIPNDNFNTPNPFNQPINDFSFPGSNTNSNMAIPNQGGLFNAPLNIVSVPNNQNINEPINENSNDNSNISETNMDFDSKETPNDINNNSSFESNNQENSDTRNTLSETDNKIDNNSETEKPDFEQMLDAKIAELQAQKAKMEADNNEAPSEGGLPNEVENQDSNTATSETPKKDYIKLEPEITINDPRSAVLELKKTTDRIKQENIKMDTEEIEFDDYYQITIKIKK